MKLVRFESMNENELFACYNPPILPEVIELPEIKAMMADAFNYLVQQKQQKILEDDHSKTRKGQIRREYRLSNAYKDQTPQLWCSLNEKDANKSDKAVVEIKNQFNNDKTADTEKSESVKDTGNISGSSNNSETLSTSRDSATSKTSTDISDIQSKRQITSDLISQLAFSTSENSALTSNSSSVSSASSSRDEGKVI